jgi:hypothetical protein
LGDDIRTGSGFDTVWAGAARTSSARVMRALIRPGPGHDRVFAGAGPDVVIANEGERDVTDCGPGYHRPRVDRVDLIVHYEHVTVSR